MGIGPFTKKDHLTISTLGLEFAAAQGAGLFAGYWLDKRFDTRPVFMLAGLALGFVLGLYIVIKAAKNMERENSNLTQTDKKADK